MLERTFYIFYTTLSLIHVAQTYSGGAPEGACSRMTPGHGVAPQSSTPPYTVTSSKSTIAPGQSLQVTISSKNRKPFDGFFIRARQNGQYLPGIFTVQDGTRLRCNGQGITHQGATKRQSVQVVWTAPEVIDPSPIDFIATVVEERVRFWTFIPSGAIQVVSSAPPTGGEGGGDVTTNPMNATRPGLGTTHSNPGTSNIDGSANTNINGDDEDDNNNSPNSRKTPGEITLHSDCGKTRGCFHDCQDGSCSFVVYWKPLNNSVLVRIVHKLPSSSEKWIALGLSHDKLMGDDSVMECVMGEDEVLVKTSYNNGQYNVYPDDKQAAMSRNEGFVNDGVLGCQFVRKNSYPREPKVFDLHSTYYLFVATGEAVAGNKFPHSYEELPIVSRSKISLLHIKEVEKGPGVLYPMVKAHGTAMTLAWVLFANIGVFVSRHGRNMFNSTTPCGANVWFHIHRFCMTMTLFLTLVGFLLILIESHGRSHIPQLPGKSYVILHPPLGLIVIILTIVNPLMALFRPDHSSPSRPLFRWTHWGFGVFAWFVSFIVLAIGLNLQKAHAEIEAVYIMFAFMGYSFVMEILIRVLPFICGAVGYCCKEIACNHYDSYDFNIELRSSEVASVSSANVISNKEVANADLERITRTENAVVSMMIIVHILACTGFTSGVLFFSLRHSVAQILST